ncbi:hypothetical protein LR48_Vigan08g019300 [Vigna angularis]|uniref:Uncharacterized protein n=1 Tax=Phaseolus angularis TaxID=3914 RepID=A0A0L9V328_PHAAN|nr:hypothetical protein LR48_Vigan08g019300 [Vigna angularis]
MLRKFKNHERGSKGSENFVNGGRKGRTKELLQDIMTGKKKVNRGIDAEKDSMQDIKKGKKPSNGGENSINWEKRRGCH